MFHFPLLTLNFRDFQQITYPILWGGHLARPVHRAGKMPTPQELCLIQLCKLDVFQLNSSLLTPNYSPLPNYLDTYIF